MDRRSRAWLAGTLACAVALSFAGVALAHAYSAPSTITLRYDEDERKFSGRVRSPRESCVDLRKVKLRHHKASGEVVVVGRTRTDDEGRWRVSEANAEGVYSAVVVRRQRTPVGHVHQCQRGASGTVTVEP